MESQACCLARQRQSPNPASPIPYRLPMLPVSTSLARCGEKSRLAGRAWRERRPNLSSGLPELKPQLPAVQMHPLKTPGSLKTSLGGRSNVKYLRPENINGSSSVTRRAVRRLAELLERRAFIAMVLVFSMTAYGAPQSHGSAAAYGALQNQGEQATPQTPAGQMPTAAPPQTPVVLLEDGHPTTQATAPRGPQAQPPKQENKVELTDFQLLVQSSLGQALPIYGASLFENVPSTFAPVDHIPVTADYVIGPGDELMIRAWGQIDLDVHARVDRNGNVFLPKVGSVNVSGLKYAQIEDFMRSHIGRIYQNFDLNVTMGDLRSIDIFVVGQVTRPGRYTVSSLSTLTNAIFACGGPSSRGSMREVQLKRGRKVVSTFDLYDLLINGDKSKDVVLQPEDVIYVSSSGPEIALGGQVNVPAVYELKTETKLSEAIRLAGGLSNTAYGGKVYIEHIVNHSVRSVEEVSLDATGLAHPLVDGDIVNFTAVSPKFENSVTLRGNVAQPGRYPHAKIALVSVLSELTVYRPGRVTWP